MAAPPNILPAQPVSATPAPSRVGGGYFTSADQLDAASGSAFVAVAGHWQPANDQHSGQPGSGQYPQASGGAFPLTPLVYASAAAFAANEAGQADIRGQSPRFLTDLQRGVGIYEYNMKIFAGSLRTQGGLVNRYS